MLKQHGGVAVIDCHATWCGPCKMIGPKAIQWSDSYGVLLIKVDVDESPELSNAYNIKAMPTFFLVQGTWNNKKNEVVGANQAKVEDLFKNAAQLKKWLFVTIFRLLKTYILFKNSQNNIKLVFRVFETLWYQETFPIRKLRYFRI